MSRLVVSPLNKVDKFEGLASSKIHFGPLPRESAYIALLASVNRNQDADRPEQLELIPDLLIDPTRIRKDFRYLIWISAKISKMAAEYDEVLFLDESGLGYFTLKARIYGLIKATVTIGERTSETDLLAAWRTNGRFPQNVSELVSTHMKQFLAKNVNPSGLTGRVKSQNSDPLVSVCIATHNRADLLLELLRSLENQNYSNFEVIIVDDGSTNRIRSQQLEAVLSKPVQLIFQTNQGPGAARNAAAQRASGELLVFMDDDDIAKENDLEVLVRSLVDQDQDLLCCAYTLFDRLDGGSPREIDDHHFLGQGTLLGLYFNCFGNTHHIVKKRVFEELGGFKETLDVGHEDWEYFVRASLAGYKMDALPASLFYYRISSTSRQQSTPRFRNLLETLDLYSKAMPSGLEVLPYLTFGQFESEVEQIDKV